MEIENLSGPGSPSSLRMANQKRVLAAIIDAGGISQAEISRRTGLAPATVSNIVRELTDVGILRLAEAASGRRGNTIAFAPDIGYAMGVSIEREQVRVGIVTLDHTIVDTQILPMARGFSAEEGQEKAVDLFDAMMAQRGLKNSQVVAGCVVVANAVRSDGTLSYSTSMIPGWNGVNLEEKAQAIAPFPILTENDANAGALAEHMWGEARDIDDFIYVEASFGIGAGIMNNGQILYGTGGISGEIGHLPVPGYTTLCKCGGTGCLETVASVSAILSSLQEIGLSVHSLSDLFRLIDEGDVRVIRRVQKAATAMGYVLAQTCNILNPKMIVIGGVLSNAGSLYLNQVRETINEVALPDCASDMELRLSKLGSAGPLRGAMAKAVSMANLDAILQKFLLEDA
ncbi:MAG: ROK family transcriptional regulator [Mobiluncus porci]|uniref:ROK family transcriptional regulator n=1 Tax=Mobiluncus TaxID=2050 RepID=UPI0023F1474A|nr:MULTISPECIES: ROK family transcriptional regulator [Mobiluncus]MCI6583638.1 ROK family transcriptional regulator [Mobiluncus sp.]MDD7541219.1 ROK family transcriptional regulator [Mobiluncus porci]MDY5748109.1 ROK family transcriptional regulator [Mobiluncus porci]